MSVQSDSAIGVQEFAEVVGNTRRTVSNLIRTGVLTKRARGLALKEAVHAYIS